MKKSKNGSVLILSMIFVCIFATLAMALFSASSANLQIARNYAKANRAFEAASSGLNITKYWMTNDVNGFAGTYHVLSSSKQQGFIVDVNETGDPNELAITVTGFAGEFEKVLGGNFVYNINPGWRFVPATYWEDKK